MTNFIENNFSCGIICCVGRTVIPLIHPWIVLQIHLQLKTMKLLGFSIINWKNLLWISAFYKKIFLPFMHFILCSETKCQLKTMSLLRGLTLINLFPYIQFMIQQHILCLRWGCQECCILLLLFYGLNSSEYIRYVQGSLLFRGIWNSQLQWQPLQSQPKMVCFVLFLNICH